jgi:lysyl-tRNA synthetase class 2
MLGELSREREAKLRRLRELGIDPYRGEMSGIEAISAVLEKYREEAPPHPDPLPQRAEGDQREAHEPPTVIAAGRIVGGLRLHGKSAFFHLQDWTGRVQVYVRKDALGDVGWEVFGLLDIGDVVGVRGALQKTRTGELTIFADRLVPLSKALLPLPEKWHGLTDVETRYRHRSLDLIANAEVMQRFLLRTRVVAGIRRFLEGRGFVEVETPMMQPIPGGAAARPFVTHHNALDLDLYLRISPELYLKRLLVGGMERVYEINRNFRNEGISATHSPEFTMLEAYQAYSDLAGMMELAESMLVEQVRAVSPTLRLPFGEWEIDYTSPWSRRRYGDLLREHAGLAIDDVAGARAKAAALGLDIKGRRDCDAINTVFEATCETALVDPTFVYDYPAELCPLTRRRADDPGIAERFELFIGRMEIANAYSELNDPLIQEQLFREQAGEEESMVGRIDTAFLTAMRHGMPPAGGIGIGIDRVVMLLTNTHVMRDVVLFPLLRPAPEEE